MGSETAETAAAGRAPRIEIALVVSLLFAALVYAPVVRNSFHSDDFYHLYDLVNSSFAQFIARTHGGHLYWFRNLVFYFCYRLFRTEPVFYYGLAFVTHLLNVFLFYRVVRASTASARLACFGAVLWGTMPANEGAIGWFSVYGHALAATFTLAVLGRMTAIASGAAPTRWEPLWWALAVSVGATCFGIGLAIAGAMPAVAFLLLPRSALRRRAVAVLTLVVVLLPAVYMGAERLDGVLHGEPVENATKLLTVLSQWPNHLQLFYHLLVFGAASLVLTTFYQPSILGPVDMAIALAVAFVCLVSFAVASGGARRKAAAFLLLAVAAYGMIALGRGVLVKPENVAWVAASPRFHYFGPCMLALTLCVLLAEVGRARRLRSTLATGLLVFWMLLVLRGHQSGRGIDHYESNRTEAERILNAVRARAKTSMTEEVYVENHKFNSIGPFLLGDPHFPGWAAVFAIYFPDAWIDGKRVRFVESDPKILETARMGRVSADLFLRPEDVPLAARLTERPRSRRPPRAHRQAAPEQGRIPARPDAP